MGFVCVGVFSECKLIYWSNQIRSMNQGQVLILAYLDDGSYAQPTRKITYLAKVLISSANPRPNNDWIFFFFLLYRTIYILK